MEIVIDVTSPVHQYIQVADQLREAIAGGETVAGVDLSTGAFPSLWDLVKETGVAYNTVRRATEILKGEGLIRAVPGRGTFIQRKEAGQ